MSVAEYVAKCDELARFAPTMVPTYEARKMKFMHGLCPEVAKQIDNGREGPESFADAVQRVMRNDRWDKQDDKGAETRSTRQEEGKERKENYGKGGQSSFRFRNFNRSIRPSFKKQSYSYSES